MICSIPFYSVPATAWQITKLEKKKSKGSPSRMSKRSSRIKGIITKVCACKASFSSKTITYGSNKLIDGWYIQWAMNWMRYFVVISIIFLVEDWYKSFQQSNIIGNARVCFVQAILTTFNEAFRLDTAIMWKYHIMWENNTSLLLICEQAKIIVLIIANGVLLVASIYNEIPEFYFQHGSLLKYANG